MKGMALLIEIAKSRRKVIHELDDVELLVHAIEQIHEADSDVADPPKVRLDVILILKIEEGSSYLVLPNLRVVDRVKQVGMRRRRVDERLHLFDACRSRWIVLVEPVIRFLCQCL